jgi:RNA polymerase sigma-70 factor, ECF subfamily
MSQPGPGTGTIRQGDRKTHELDLVRRICAGERELYYELIQPYERSVFLAALAITRNEADAEEVAQEAFLKAFRGLPGFRAEARFSTWLERIAVNEARMRLRRARIEKAQPLEDEESEDGAYIPMVLSDWRELPSEILERKEIREILRRAMMQLPEKYRVVLELRDVQQKNIAETAELLGLTAGAVKTRLLRARLQLRDLIVPYQQNSAATSANPFKKGRNPW